MTLPNRPGISGIAVHLPPLRVSLEAWCRWTGADWRKVQNIAGHSFRMLSPRESAYTLAAEAVLSLIERYDIDPASVGMLALGTESSTDNAAGAVIVRGMVDRALYDAGLPMLSPQCEVPEFKHACLGGIYALKSATRFVATDGRNRRAIVVAVDVAEYARGSSGEQTQGAGAVAMLVEPCARLLELDLDHAASASNYRGPDFRKPTRRFDMEGYAAASRTHDFPVFNGRYSTVCYRDQTARAVEGMCHNLGLSLAALFDQADAIFFHRPYHHMPIQALADLVARTLVEDDGPEATALITEAGASRESLRDELAAPPQPFAPLDAERSEHDPTPGLTALARLVRRTPAFEALRARLMDLGVDTMKQCGNMYTAALPAWLAAGLEHALERNSLDTGALLIAVGYGSGDAAEAIPMRLAANWREAASRIHFAQSLQGAVDLDQADYEALHDGRPVRDALLEQPTRGFVIDRIGTANDARFQDIGLEYYVRR